jgi:hypothetical protein
MCSETTAIQWRVMMMGRVRRRSEYRDARVFGRAGYSGARDRGFPRRDGEMREATATCAASTGA